MLKDVVSESEQNIFIKGSLSFHTKFEEMFKKKIMEGSKEEFLTLISLYFKLPSEKQNQIFEFLKKTEEEVENLELYYIYKYLTFIRYYTLFGFYTSERVGKEILNYKPISSSFQGCVPLCEVNNLSSSN